ncbi:flotillin domain-containing protein [Mesorhizobium sp. VNQ89]|uniref:flotillin domain-containing protein n=1 Tax=Mesorhizobium quangtriensis TaxID=3157709 RepID=UPI0032B7B61B
MTGADIIAIIILLTILIAVGVYLLHWLYRHSSKDQSFVRTGSGGERVVMGGGALVIPIIHDITVVNMNATPIEVRRQGEQSLITKNKMRVDITTEFFVRVIATNEGVSTAARTLGARTQDPIALKEVIQGRLVDAMASVTATMTMNEIHENRASFIRQVSELVKGVLAMNGLELETAALTSLNQSDISVFDPSNHFDAEGLTLIVKETEERRKLRNQIENETKVQIKLRDFEAEQRVIEIDRDLEYVRIEQARDIETKKAQQAAAIEAERASSQIAITQSRTKAEEESERVMIAKGRAIDEERIRAENDVKALEIERQRDTELTEITSKTRIENERIQARQQVEAERIQREHEIREAQIASRQQIALHETKADGEVESARLATQQDVETARIQTGKLVELASVEREKEIKVSSEKAKAETERAALTKKLAVENERLKTEEEIRSREINRQHKIKLAETASFREVEDARVVAEREIEELRIAARKYIERFEIEQAMEIEIADKERLIAVVNKAIDEAVVRTNEAEAQRKLALTQEKIETSRAEEKANRSKTVEIIDATARAEREAIRVVKQSEAEKTASELRAEAEIAEAKAAEFRYEVDSGGNRKLNEAENVRSEESRRSAILEGVVTRLPEIIREQVKPMENIDSIKILQVDGLPGLNSPSESGSGGGGGNISDQVVNSAMKYRTQVAFVDGLMEEIGLPLKNLGAAGGMQFKNFPPKPDDKDSDD